MAPNKKIGVHSGTKVQELPDAAGEREPIVPGQQTNKVSPEAAGGTPEVTAQGELIVPGGEARQRSDQPAVRLAAVTTLEGAVLNG